jgi:hypothetical protein
MPPNKSEFTAMLVGHYDPPTLDYVRAVEALRADGYGTVYSCPVSSGNKEHDAHVRAMTSILSMESSVGNIVLCSVGLDKGLSASDMRLWLEKKYPNSRFRVAFLASDPQPDGVPIVIGNISKNLHDPIYIPRHLSCQEGIVERIAAGRDESRGFTALVWNYIRRHGLYVPKEEKKDASTAEVH